MKCLAFDLATKTGIAFGEAGGKPRAWSVDLGRKMTDGERFARAIRMTERFISDLQPNLVAIEAPVGGREASAFLIGLIACVEGQSVRMGVRTEKYYPATVRRHFLGKALQSRDFPSLTKVAAKRAIKQAVITRCNLLGWTTDDPDCADAMALFDLACTLVSPSHQLTTLPGMFSRG